MKYLLSIISCVVLLSVIAFAVAQAQEEVLVDRGYECFNLEIAQAQLSYVQEHGNWWEIWSARRSVKNWEKLCK